MRLKSFVLVHADDIDGVGSAAIITMKFGTRPSNIFFSDYTKERATLAVKYLKKRIKKCDMPMLVIADLSDSILKYVEPLLASLKKSGGHIIWLDHHLWINENVKKVSELCDFAIVGENKYACATEISSAFLKVNSKFVKKFIKIVHYSDFNIEAKNKDDRKLIKDYALAISSYNMMKEPKRTRALRSMVKVIASGKFIDRRIEKSAHRFEAENERKVKEMAAKADVLGNVAIGFASGVQSTYACNYLIKEKGVDIGIVVSPETGKGSIRSVKSDIHRIAMELGGGGHPHASGFNFNTAKPSGSEKWKKEAEDKIKRVLIKLGIIS